MNDRLKELLACLKETMQELTQYPQELNDWMLSNHSYIKTDSPNLVNYLPEETLNELKQAKEDKELQERRKFKVKVKGKDGKVEEVDAEKIQSEEKTNEFFERAGVISGPSKSSGSSSGVSPAAEKTANLKKMAAQIKMEGAGSLIMTKEEFENFNSNEPNEYSSLISGGNDVNHIDQDGAMDDIKVPGFIINANQAAASKLGGGMSRSSKEADDLKSLQAQVSKSKELGAGGFGRA
jgi:hypothetical protein